MGDFSLFRSASPPLDADLCVFCCCFCFSVVVVMVSCCGGSSGRWWWGVDGWVGRRWIGQWRQWVGVWDVVGLCFFVVVFVFLWWWFWCSGVLFLV